MEYRLQHGVHKIRRMMTRKARDNIELEEIVMVDVIHRLGLEDYFQEEIQASLETLIAKFTSLEEEHGDYTHNFYKIALSFRLLRQQGYHISADIFGKFKNKDGKFKREVCKDVRALLSIFESCQLISTSEEEEILGEASEFSVQLLKTSLNNIEESKARIIENTLRNPFHKNLARLLANKFLQDFDISFQFLHDLSNVEDQWMNEVHELAIIDFQMAQMNYRTEVQEISRWVQKLNLDKELSFARIQPIKWCLWSLGIFPGPKMSKERIELAKAGSFIYIIDDIFDSHDNYDELYLFTKAINRWDYSEIRSLPKPMKVCFKALLEMINDFSFKIMSKYGWNPQECLRKLWAEQLNAYLVESKWSFAKYTPSSKEYLKNAIVTSGTHVVLAHAFFLLGQGINKQSVEDLSNLPSIISSTATVLRLWNDVGIHTDKTPDGSDGSYINYYMKEKKTRSLERSRGHVSGLISDAWKCLNKEYMSSASLFSKDFKLACINLARLVPIMYSQDKTHLLQYVIKS